MKSRKLISSIISVFALLLYFNQLSLAFSITDSHPRIFITSNDIPTLKARCGIAYSNNSEYSSHSMEYNNLKQAADRYSSTQINSFDGLNKGRLCLANAFVYLMEGGSSYYNKAKVLLDHLTTLGRDDKDHYGFFAACIIFDWLYNDLNQSERDKYAGDIVHYVLTDSWYSQYNSFDPYYHARKYVSSLFAVSGQAIYNEYPEYATEFITRALSVFHRMMIAQKEIARDGFIYPIGQPGYFDESSWQSALRVLAGLKLAGISGPEIDSLDFSSIAKTAYGEIYALVKNNYVISHNDGYNTGVKPWRISRGPDGPFYSAILAKLYEGQEIGKITNYLQSHYNASNISEKPFCYLGSILFDNKIANNVGGTVASLPLTKIFDDTVLVYRSGWGGLTADKKEILFNFMCEKQVNGHTHYAKGHFDIWRGYDPLTFASGNYCNTSYQHYLYYNDSLAHNVMLIRNPNENTGSRPNDGGQLTSTGEGNARNMQSSSAWRTIGHTKEGGASYTGKIERSAFSEDYFYAYFHYPSAYSSSKINDISRSVVRLGNYFIILDRINGVNASFKKRWLLHSIGIPTIVDSGSWNGGTSLDNNGGTPNQTSNNTKLLKIVQGDSSLFIKNIYPIHTLIHRVGGSSSYRWYSYNEGRNYSQGAPSGPQYGNWRIEIESNENTKDDIFLTVLYPTAIYGTMAETIGLSGNNYVGVQINDASITRVALFSNSVNESTKEKSYIFTVNTNSNLQILACDLQARKYNVYKNNVLVGTFTVTEDSKLFLKLSGGGNFQILPVGGNLPGIPPNFRHG